MPRRIRKRNKKADKKAEPTQERVVVVGPEVVAACVAAMKGRNNTLKVLNTQLRVGGWVLVRKRNHVVYERHIRSAGGKGGRETTKRQVFIYSQTPSGCRHLKNSIACLMRLDRELLEACRSPAGA